VNQNERRVGEFILWLQDRNSRIVDLLEDVLESAVIFLQNRVLGRHELEADMGQCHVLILLQTKTQKKEQDSPRASSLPKPS
jgi:hypothetical protein